MSGGKDAGSGEYDVKGVVEKMAHIQNRRIEVLEGQQTNMRIDIAETKTLLTGVITSGIDIKKSIEKLTDMVRSTQIKVAVIMGGCTSALIIMQILEYLKK